MVRPTKRDLASLAAAGLLGVLVTTATGCFLDEFEPPPPPPRPVSNWTVEDARQFDEFAVYWLGESYQGLPLTSMHSSTDGDEVKHASFFYGEPSLSGDPYSPSWNPPLEVDIQPYCGFPPEEFLFYANQDYGVESEVSEIRIRGVDGYLERYSSDEASLFLWSGPSTIHLYTWQNELDIEQAALDLIPIAEYIGAMVKPLPPPTEIECNWQAPSFP